MSPFFSIIIPTYNRAALIRRAIESVLAQSFAEWELLVVDDGSTDNTKDTVSAYKDERIKYIFQANAERSAARNKGIQQAAGTYICFLDSDDYYLPDRLQKLHAEIVRGGERAAFYYTGIAYNRQEKISERPELKNTSANIFDFIVQAIIGTPQVCIHKSILRQKFFNPQFNIGEDMELWLRIAATNVPEYLENQFTVVAVEHEERSVNVKRYNSYPDQLRMLKNIFSGDHPGKNISPGVKKLLLSNCYFGIAKYFIYADKNWKAIKNLLSSILSDINHVQNKYRLNLILRLLLPGGIKKAKQLLE